MVLSEVAPPTLMDIPLDLQIIICMLLHPSDILALRKTCKAFRFSTRQRVVWVAALHRICLDNTLFLPSFPITDMSNAELEQAAMAPRRWIGRCAAFEKQHQNDSGTKLSPGTIRIIEDSFGSLPGLFIVPGGRYLVSYSPKSIFLWDMGYTSSAGCKLIASVGPEGGSYCCIVGATIDGMGLIIFSSRSYEHCSVYEIYPQSETPELAEIAYLDFNPSKDPPAHLLPDRVIWYGFYEDRIVFRIWDYRLNHSASFSALVDLEKFEYNLEVIATETAIIVLCEENILVWAIPLLSPQPPDFFDYNPTQIPPLFRIPFLVGTIRQAAFDTLYWKTISSWYFSSQPLYFDMACRSKLHRFEIIIKPDLSDAFLQVINTSELTPHDFEDVTFSPYSICEDTLVSCWYSTLQCGAYTGLTSSRFANILSRGGPAAKMLLPMTESIRSLSLCPASGRFVYIDRSNVGRIVVIDFS